MEKTRKSWIDRIEAAWKRRPLLWLKGVRRAGKTVLSRSLKDVEYFDCEIPRVRAEMEDPEFFLKNVRGRRIVLDEVHRLHNPSELLKIAADHFPDVRVLATGSSSLQASRKFRDALTGRKTEVHLTPMNEADRRDFGGGLEHRLLRGGLPPFYLSNDLPDREFQEWMDSYWAKDVQELYRLERRSSFQKFAELLFAQSGGLFDVTRFATACEVARPTISNYLQVLADTGVAVVLPPFAKQKNREIVAAPKVYGFDTGFVAYHRRWSVLHPEEKGQLWEHYVLNEFLSREGGPLVHHWRDKQGHEVDFVLARRGLPPVAVECKWSWRNFTPEGFTAFRHLHPDGPNWLVAADVDKPSRRKEKNWVVEVLPLEEAARRMTTMLTRESSGA